MQSQYIRVADLSHSFGPFAAFSPEAFGRASIVLSALIVLAYIFLGGLTSAIYNEVLAAGRD